MREILFFIVLIPVFIINGYAQKSVWDNHSDKPPLKWKHQHKRQTDTTKQKQYDQSLSFIFSFNTNGWNSSIKYGTGKHKQHIFRLGISEILHDKETRIMQENTEFYQIGKRTPFVFGKINNIYMVHLMYSKDITLLPSTINGYINIGISYGAGINLAISKPYLINYISYNSSSEEQFVETIRYESQTHTKFLERGNILGAAPWTDGFKYTKVSPGVMGDLAVFITPNHYDRFVKKIAVGVNLNYTLYSLEIMANNQAKILNPYCYIGLEAGIQWKK